MSLLSYLFPQAVLITSSKYNKLIRVNEEYGKYKLLVNGSRQSGEFIRKLWQKALNDFGLAGQHLQGDPLQNMLVLGVAGGTVIYLLHDLYPSAKITGVDIDRKMLDIGKKYFGLAEISGLTLINADALDFVTKVVLKKLKYDVIVIDLFIGRQIPEFVSNKDFLIKIRSLLNQSGKLLINYLREQEYAQKSDRLLKTLKTVFPEVTETQITRNRFFLAAGK